MKLHQTYLSPFPTRVRLVLYAKGLDIPFVEPSGIHDRSGKGDYLKINPLGRVPTLELDDGRTLPESEVICEYLEDMYPTPTLRPADPWDRAQVRLIARLCDFYLVVAMVPLFTASGMGRKRWDSAKIDAALAEVKKSLDYLEHYIGTDGYAVGKSLTQADGALAPQLMLAFEWAPKLFGRASPQDQLPKLSAYWKAIQHDPIAARVIRETSDAIAAAQTPKEKQT
ncbi:MAG TPA: glutathione S-transferase family protein [Rhizomicrobium sp.]